MSQSGPREADTCRELVVPALQRAGWQQEQLIEQYPVAARRVLTLGGIEREIGSGVVDYVLEAIPGTPVAVVEAKREYRSAADRTSASASLRAAARRSSGVRDQRRRHHRARSPHWLGAARQ